MCWLQLVEISKALLTPVIAVVATYIAWQQWQTNKNKLDLERYDRRLKIYEEVKKLLSLITRDADAKIEDLLEFRRATAQADFLFGKDIPDYLDQIYKRGVSLRTWNSQYRDYTQEKPKDYDHKKVVDNMHEELTWLTEQFGPAKEKFKKYLDISK